MRPLLYQLSYAATRSEFHEKRWELNGNLEVFQTFFQYLESKRARTWPWTSPDVCSRQTATWGTPAGVSGSHRAGVLSRVQGNRHPPPGSILRRLSFSSALDWIRMRTLRSAGCPACSGASRTASRRLLAAAVWLLPATEVEVRLGLGLGAP